MTFRILEVFAERRPNGKAFVTAKHIEKGNVYKIELTIKDLTNRELIKKELEKCVTEAASLLIIKEGEII